MYKIYFFSCLAMCFFSCNKDLTIALPYDENKIVLNSLIAKDSIIYARLTAPAQANTFSDINSGQVFLYKNGVFLEKLTPTYFNFNLYYISVSKALEGYTYTLKATAPGRDAAEGTDIIPGKPFYTALSFKKINSKHKVQIQIKDNPYQTNFYRLRIFGATENDMNQIEIDKSWPQYFTVDNVDLSGLGIFSTVEDEVSYFSDEKFNGENIDLNISLDNYDEDNTHIALELEGLTKASFQYLKSKYQSSINVSNNPFSENVIIYNNIKGGYGIVGGVAERIIAIKKQ